jgi:hypothetical protein
MKQILKNTDSQIRTLKICIADLIGQPFFKRFILWIWFVRSKIPNYSICFDSKDSYTIPASFSFILVFLCVDVLTLYNKHCKHVMKWEFKFFLKLWHYYVWFWFFILLCFLWDNIELNNYNFNWFLCLWPAYKWNVF